MGLPRYENIDQLPNIALTTRTQIEYIVMQTMVPGGNEDAIAELQAIIDYLLYLLGTYQPQLIVSGVGYDIITPLAIIQPVLYTPV